MTTTTATTLTKHAEHVMGTVFSIHVADEGNWRVAIGEVVEYLHWVDEIFSTYRPDSQTSRLSRGEMRLRDCHRAVSEALGLCADVQETTDGYFTATCAGSLDPSGLVKGWGDRRSQRDPECRWREVARGQRRRRHATCRRTLR